MKQYGANKSTEFSKKQISVIYMKAKSGELKVEKWYINHLYNLADYYGYDDNRSVENEERTIKEILKNVFTGKLQEAQELIDSETESNYNMYGKEVQATLDRTIM